MSRVAVTVEQFWHRVPGGTARATAHTLRALQRAGSHELLGIAARHGVNSPPLLPVPIPVAHAKVPRPLLYEGWHRGNVGRVQKVLGDVDLIWASAMVVPPASAPVVATVHDLDFLDHPEWLSNRGRRFFPRAWAVTKSRAARVVCPSETVAQACVRHGIAEKRVSVVPWGVEPTQVTDEEAAQVRKEFNLPNKFALWVGTLEPRKNLQRVVKAISPFDELSLVVVGPKGWNVDADELLKPLGERVVRLVDVADQDLHCLYKAAAVFVFPSLAEGFGLPVLEAMAQGTPVVTSAGTATADAAGGAALLVDPMRTDQITAAVHRILSDDEVSQRLVKAGLARVTVSTWDETALGYSRVFDEVAR